MSLPLLLDALFALAVLYLCRRLKRFPRLVAIMCAFGAFFIATAFPVLLGSLAGRAATNVGLGILLLADLIGGVVFFGEVLFGRKHHPLVTPLTAMIFGFAMAATLVDWPQVKHHSTRIAPATAHALQHAITQARHVHANTASEISQQYSHLMLVAVGVLVFALFLRWHHRRTHQPQVKPLSVPGGKFLSNLNSKNSSGGSRKPGSALVRRQLSGTRGGVRPPWDE